MDWKWLFIYPDYGVATINEISFPVNVPVKFKITSDSVMNSFFIPQLGSQIYAMAGMQNTLHLIANKVGIYQGISANYSGRGFSGMKFNTLVTSSKEFNQWLANVRKSPNKLDWQQYLELAEPSENNQVSYFSIVKSKLYMDIINKYMGMKTMPEHIHSKEEV